MKEIKLCERKYCTGCMACKQKCRNAAIEIDLIEGFAYPTINVDKCKLCGLCISVCPIVNKQNRIGNRHENETKCLAAWNKNTAVRMKSSSGGAFSVLAKNILTQGGLVFGAAWDKNMNLIHKGINNEEELDALRRSKYVQSNSKNTFNEVFSALKEGRKVLYCGTPCQIGGLTFFLGNKEYENLLTVDVMCQGVPSPYIFRKYIDEVEKETGWRVVDANFRTKEHGWRCGLLLLLLQLQSPEGKNTRAIKRILSKNEFYNAFIREYFMRPSCYDCRFKSNHQGYYADLTIADFWRIGNKIPLKVKDYTKGISAVVVNTEKGRVAFEACAKDMEIIERTWDEFATNGGLRSSHKPDNNDEAFEFLLKHTWCETQERYFPMTWKRKLLSIVYLTVGESLMRKLLKKTI
jgi:Pyruvate/2-oxoacid:ferredoxin oxidoreductase delta subunit